MPSHQATKHKFLTLIFVFMLCLTATAFIQTEPVTAVASQTEYLYATSAPTYIYGTSTSGSYADTVSPNLVYHVSTSASYIESPGNVAAYAGTAADDSSYGSTPWSNPTRAQGAQDGLYASAPCDPGTQYESHYLKATNFGFAIPSGVAILGVIVEFYQKETVASKIRDSVIKLVVGGSATGNNKAETGEYWSTSWGWDSHGGSSDVWGCSLTEANVEASNFGVVLAVTLPASTSQGYVDSVRITVYYGNTRYRLDYYYSFQFTDSAKAAITQLDVGATGTTSSVLVWCYFWNWTTSAWDYCSLSGMAHLLQQYVETMTPITYYPPYIPMADNGSVRFRFQGYDLESSSYTFSIDYVYLKITYSPLVPGTPTLTSPSDGSFIGTSTVNLTWSGTDTYFLRYQLQTSTNDAFTQNLVTYNQTASYKVWSLSAEVNGTLYWRVRIVNLYQGVSPWASRSFTIGDPMVSIVFRDANNPALNEIINPAAFNTTYHRSTEDPAGVWHTLSPYFPIISMYSNEFVNITVRDWLGNYLINNQQYTYTPSIVLDLNIWDVCVGNGADAMAYIILRSGSTILHKFTYRSDIHWLVIPGTYNLTVVYPSVGNIQIYYNLTITGDYGIKVSSNAVADLYSASDNWADLTANVNNIVTRVNDLSYSVYIQGTTQDQMKTNIENVSTAIQNTQTTVGDIENIQFYEFILVCAVALGILITLITIAVKGRPKIDFGPPYRHT